MDGAGLEEVFASGRRNAVLAWILVAAIGLIWLVKLAIGAYVWSSFALTVLVLAVLPPVIFGSRYVMLPWEVLGMAALPLLGLVIATELLSNPLFDYLAVAAVALVIVVELDSFTSIRMSPGFAIVLVVAATMAAAAAWALLQWYASMVTPTGYDPTNDELMIEFLYSALAGLAAGVTFRAYFRRYVSLPDRLPVELEDESLPESFIQEAEER